MLKHWAIVAHPSGMRKNPSGTNTREVQNPKVEIRNPAKRDEGAEFNKKSQNAGLTRTPGMSMRDFAIRYAGAGLPSQPSPPEDERGTERLRGRRRCACPNW